jgi:hypothetical protein
MPSTAPSAFPERRACCRVTSVRLAPSAAAMATELAHLVHPELPASLAQMEPLALLAHKEPRVCPETCQPSTTITNASAAIAPMAHLAHPANLERREPQDPTEDLDQPATTPRTANLDHPAHLAMVARLDPKAPPVLLAHLARTEAKAARANLDPLDPPAQPDPRATMAHLAHSPRMENKDALDPLAQLERPAQPDRMETPDPLVPMDHPARMPLTALAPNVPTRRRHKCTEAHPIIDHFCNVKAKIALIVSPRLAVGSITTAAATLAPVIFACSMRIVSIQKSLL